MLVQTALKYDVEVSKDGHIELNVPLPAGARVTIFVVEASDSFSDILSVSESSQEFWNHPLDDKGWNNA